MRTGGEDISAAAESSERVATVRRTASAPYDLAPLIPTSPPGRVTRKARHYVAQILRLREQGYTLETIQQALADVGVNVSVSTVRRESLRPMPATLALPADAVTKPPPTSPPAGPSPPATAAARPPASVASLPPATPKELAETYALGHRQNPLVRAKEQSS